MFIAFCQDTACLSVYVKCFMVRKAYSEYFCQTIAAIYQPHPGILDGKGKDNVKATGILLPGMEARIVRDDGSEADWDEVGELWLRGENIVPGYWNNPEANATTFVDGWLRTGDKFRVDKDQYF